MDLKCPICESELFLNKNLKIYQCNGSNAHAFSAEELKIIDEHKIRTSKLSPQSRCMPWPPCRFR
jgi:hypothetical protein